MMIPKFHYIKDVEGYQVWSEINGIFTSVVDITFVQMLKDPQYAISLLNALYVEHSILKVERARIFKDLDKLTYALANEDTSNPEVIHELHIQLIDLQKRYKNEGG